MRRPLAVTGFSFLAALIAAAFLNDVFGTAGGVTADAAAAAVFLLFAGVAALILRSLPFRAGTVAALVFVAAAFAWYGAKTVLFYEPVASLDGQTVTVSGTTADFPQLSNGKYVYTVNTTLAVGGRNVKTAVRVYSKKDIGARPYDFVTLKAELYLPLSDPGTGYSSREYYRSKGVFLFATPESDIAVKKNPKPPLLYYAILLRQQMLSNLHAAVSGVAGSLAGGILIGDVSGLSDKIRQDFTDTGISHILAVSGTQTSLIAQCLLLALCFLKMPKRAACAVSGLAVLAFMAITGFSPSVTRAGIMSILYLSALMVGRRADALNSLGFSVLALCMLNPYAATDTGLLLSFAATLGMILLSGRLNAAMVRTAGAWPKPVKALALKPAGVLSETLGASLFTVPVILLIFRRVSVIALISNLAEVPVSLAVTLLSAVIVIIAPIRFLGFLVFAAGFVTKYACLFMLWFASLLASLPFASVSSSYGFVTIYFVFLLAIAAVLLIFRGRGAHAGVAAVCCLFTLSAAILSFTVASNGVLEAAALPVGKGQCAVLVKDGSAVVIGLSGYRPELSVQDFLKARDIKTVEAVVLTGNGTSDSIKNLRAAMPCKRIFCPRNFDCGGQKDLRPVDKTAWIDVLDGVKLRILADDDGSLGVSAVYGGSRLLFIGGAQSEATKTDVVFFDGSISKTLAGETGAAYAIAGGSSSSLYSCANFESLGCSVRKTGELGVVRALTRGNGRYLVRTGL